MTRAVAIAVTNSDIRSYTALTCELWTLLVARSQDSQVHYMSFTVSAQFSGVEPRFRLWLRILRHPARVDAIQAQDCPLLFCTSQDASSALLPCCLLTPTTSCCSTSMRSPHRPLAPVSRSLGCFESSVLCTLW